MTGAFADGVMFQWDTNSMGGRQAVNDLLIAIMQRYRAGETLLYPKVKLSGSSYFNKTRQEEIWNPKLEILGWADRDGNETASEAKLSPPVEAPPHDDLTQTEVPGTTAAEEPAAEEPVRRKRRSAA